MGYIDRNHMVQNWPYPPSKAEDVHNYLRNSLYPALVAHNSLEINESIYEYDARHYSTLNEAVAEIGSVVTTLVISTAMVATTVTVPSTLTLRFVKGGSLTIATGQTITINGIIDAGLDQIFSCTGTGAVAFGNTGLQRDVYVQWWGAKNDYSTDCYAAFQAAFTACPIYTLDRGRVLIPGGMYKYGTTLSISRGITVEGLGKAYLIFTGVGDLVNVTQNTVKMKNLYLEPIVANANNGYGIHLSTYGLILENVSVARTQKHCVYMTDGYFSSFTGCAFNICGGDADQYGVYHGTQSNCIYHFQTVFSVDDGTGGAYVDSGAQIAFVSCTFQGGNSDTTSKGLVIRAEHNVEVLNCYFEYIYSNIVLGGASSAPYSINITNNYFLLPNSSGCVGIQVDRGLTVRIVGNWIEGQSAGAESGILINQTTSGGAYIWDVRIEDNAISGVATNVSDALNRADVHGSLWLKTKFGSSIPADGMLYKVGSIVYDTTAAGPTGWRCTTDGVACKEQWTTGNAYTAGQFVYNSVNRVYYATTSGNAGVTEPVHTTGTASDGTVTWQYYANGATLGIATFVAWGERNGGPSNYTKFETDGTVVMTGDATVWEDLNLSGVSLGTGATAPDLIAINGTTVYGRAFDGVATTEQLFGCMEIPHSTKASSAATFHVHWCPTTADAGNVKWQLDYMIVASDGTIGTATTITGTTAAGGTAWDERRTDLSPTITVSMGSQLMFRLYRNPGDGSDTYEADALLLTAGIHYESDTIGSRAITSK